MKRSRNSKHTVLALVLLSSAVIMAVWAILHPQVVDGFNIYWMAVAAAAIPGVLLLSGWSATATYLARIIVGSIFLVSGLIKANDTMGFAFKLEEYFDENALGSFWAAFHDYALLLAILISGIEVLLGLAVLFGIRARLVAGVLLGMTLFFGWLTYYTAQCNEAQMAAMAAGESFDKVCVTDCGCFGDALRGTVGRSLTPWESFYKDLGLLFFTLVILLQSAKIKVNGARANAAILPAALVVVLLFGYGLFNWLFPTWFLLIATALFAAIAKLSKSTQNFSWIYLAIMSVLTYGFSLYTHFNLPIKDYRPYAEGKNIVEQMKTAEELGLQPTEYANLYRLKNKQTGAEKTMNSKEYLAQEVWKDQAWEIVYTNPEPIVLQRGYEPPIATYTIMNVDNSDIGDKLLRDTSYSFMVVMYDASKADEGAFDELQALAEQAQNAGYNFYAVTSSPYDVYEAMRHKHQLAFPFYTADEIFLKTIVRSNPGLVLLREGTVVEKWSSSQLPTYEAFAKEYLK